MTDELTATGLTIDDFATRLDTIVAELRTSISSVLDVSEDQPTGQIVRILTDHDQQLAELLQELHSAIDPDQATGQSLDAVCSITGTYRQAATFGTVTQACTFTGAGVVLGAGTQVSVAGDPDNIWEIITPFTSTGAGPEDVDFQCTVAGDVPALAGTITTIVTAVAGWLTTTNAADATEGEDRETDTALRLRREVEVTTGGSTSADAVAAAVSGMSDRMLAAVCYENDTWRAVAPMPPHSIEVVYWDGGGGVAVADIAEEIFEEKAGGVHAYGTNYETHTDTQGNDHQIGMTQADNQRLNVEVNLTQDTDYQGDAALTAAIVAWALAELSIGDDVYRSQISGLAWDAGALNVTSVKLSLWPAAVAAADYVIGAREIATISTGDITVNS